MFSSPAIRISSTENTNNMIMKKPGEVTITSKKPFADRSVNSVNRQETPIISKPNVKSQEDSVFDKIMQDIEYDGCSYLNHESEDLFDIYPKQTSLNNELILNILTSHCTYPDSEIPNLELGEDDFFPPMKTWDWDELRPNDDVFLPEESVDYLSDSDFSFSSLKDD